MNEKLTIMNTEHATAYLDVLFGRKTIDAVRKEFNLPPLVTSKPETEELKTEFTTKNDALFSIFPDDENSEDIRIEIHPDYVWNKEDVWELVAELLERVGSIDKEGNVLDKNDPDLNENISREKQLLVLRAPGHISDEESKTLKKNAEEVLKEAEIKGSVLILSDGLDATFLKTW